MSFVPFNFSSNDFKSFTNANFPHTLNLTNSIFNNTINGTGFQPFNNNYEIINNSNEEYSKLFNPNVNINVNHTYNISSAKSKVPLNLLQQYYGNNNPQSNQGIYPQSQTMYDNTIQMNGIISSFPPNPNQEINQMNNLNKIPSSTSLKNLSNGTSFVNSDGFALSPQVNSCIQNNNSFPELITQNLNQGNHGNLSNTLQPNLNTNYNQTAHFSYIQNDNKYPEYNPKSLLFQNQDVKNDQNPFKLRRVLSEDKLMIAKNNGENNIIKNNQEIIIHEYQENERKFKNEIISLNQTIKLMESKFISQKKYYEKKLSELQKINENEIVNQTHIKKEILFEKIEFINKLIKDYLSCPITIEPFRDPAIAPDNQTYEKEEILKWLENKSYSPITYKHLYTKVLRTNYLAKSLLSYLYQQLSSCMKELNNY